MIKKMNTKSLLCTHQQLHDVFGSSFSETQAVDERRLYIVVAWCGRGRRTVPRMRELQCILVGRILARYDSMHRRTFRQWGEMSTRRCRPRALLGAWPPTSCHISPNIFRPGKIQLPHDRGSIVLSLSNIITRMQLVQST